LLWAISSNEKPINFEEKCVFQNIDIEMFGKRDLEFEKEYDDSGKAKEPFTKFMGTKTTEQ
jgi:hypothetical protein